MTKVDLNADMGESFGPWIMGRDADLMQIITSANVACGFHAGDPSVMLGTMHRAVELGVGIGAHPGFADLQGFGRRRMHLSPDDLRAMVMYQVAASQGVARSLGTDITHVKLHGAMANMASEDEAMARAAFEGALAVAPDAPLMVVALTAQQRAAEALSATIWHEIFADRAYNANATLVDRSLPGAVIHDAELAAARMVKFVTEGAITAEDGTKLPTKIDTICCHGDTAEAVEIARITRTSLEAAGITVAKP